MTYKIGSGIDFHQLAEGRTLFLGGVEIPHHKGAVGHSDADVLLHAICDAMLGALSLGDIGKHFPDTDNAYKNIDSKILLQKTVDLINGQDYKIVNVDAAVVLQAPKIAPHVPVMQQVIASILNIPEHHVSIKATTAEKMGFLGREEGVMSIASVLLSCNNRVELKVANTSRNELPTYATKGAAGMDLRAALEQPLTLNPGERALIPTGLFIQIPEGFEAQIRPRSGLAFKHGITCLNTPGTIDSDYRGEVKVLLINLGQELFRIENNDRIAQMVLMPVTTGNWNTVDVLDDTERGSGGFGHSGSK